MKTRKYFFIIILFFLLIIAPKNAIALTSGAYKFDTLYVGIPEHDSVYGYPIFSLTFIALFTIIFLKVM